MWLLTAYGAYSAVAHREQKDTIIVRSRSLADMDALRSRHEILAKRKVKQNLKADYPWRMNVKRQQWAQVVAAEAMAIDYDNFKNAVTKRTSWRRHDIYTRIWRLLQEIEQEPGSGLPKHQPKLELGDGFTKFTPTRSHTTVFNYGRPPLDNWGRMPIDPEPEDDPDYFDRLHRGQRPWTQDDEDLYHDLFPRRP